VLLCSGILDVRLEDVTAALEKAGIRIEEVKQKEDWRSVRCRIA
jgi:ribosomal protein L11 methylase PrmA